MPPHSMYAQACTAPKQWFSKEPPACNLDNPPQYLHVHNLQLNGMNIKFSKFQVTSPTILFPFDLARFSHQHITFHTFYMPTTQFLSLPPTSSSSPNCTLAPCSHLPTTAPPVLHFTPHLPFLSNSTIWTTYHLHHLWPSPPFALQMTHLPINPSWPASTFHLPLSALPLPLIYFTNSLSSTLSEEESWTERSSVHFSFTDAEWPIEILQQSAFFYISKCCKSGPRLIHS